jgi:hypothetical protein
MRYERLNTELENKIYSISQSIRDYSLKLLQQDFELFQRDFDSTVKSLQETEVPDEEGNVTYKQDEYLSAVLDGHMDTICKTIINVVVSALTEVALDYNKTPIELPDPVEYMAANREHFNLN